MRSCIQVKKVNMKIKRWNGVLNVDENHLNNLLLFNGQRITNLSHFRLLHHLCSFQQLKPQIVCSINLMFFFFSFANGLQVGVLLSCSWWEQCEMFSHLSSTGNYEKSALLQNTEHQGCHRRRKADQIELQRLKLDTVRINKK